MTQGNMELSSNPEATEQPAAEESQENAETELPELDENDAEQIIVLENGTSDWNVDEQRKLLVTSPFHQALRPCSSPLQSEFTNRI